MGILRRPSQFKRPSLSNGMPQMTVPASLRASFREVADLGSVASGFLFGPCSLSFS